ncbi:IclR family transcriptional regulator [Amycolatopsis suaedae]|uniref:IclR family transcriptional regulator n=1 Tax=Amycolatopsis suaedae TaxID=2510978 RepID=A0A4Q7J8V7_9PSEU|nr:IclR family transcriptional regulator [Amycolatopsis suaedae]RZQ63356.1 IclR family transcriptional regulator [Amycolatopsis suaedae]
MRAVLTTFRVLEEVAHTQPIGVGELARSLNLPKSTVQRALRTLWTAGWICPDGAEVTRWVLTGRALQVGQLAIGDLSVRDAAAPVMHELRRESGETAHLMVRDGDHAVLIERIETAHPVRAVLPLGSRVPLHGSSNGKAILSTLPPERVHEILGDELERHTGSTIVDWDEFLAELHEVRRRGYAVNVGEWRTDIAAVAAPIFDHSGAAVASVSISAPSGRMPEEARARFGAMVAEAARRISATLGHRGAIDPV